MAGFMSDSYILEKGDLHDIFCRFGKLDKVLLGKCKKTGYVLFRSYHNAYVACKFLDRIKLNKLNL